MILLRGTVIGLITVSEVIDTLPVAQNRQFMQDVYSEAHSRNGDTDS